MNRADRRKSAKENEGRIEEYVAAGVAVMESGGNLEEARRQFRQALIVEPGHPAANLHMGNIEMWARNYPQAQEHFVVAYEANPQDPKLINNLALSLHEQGLVAKAVPLYEEAVKLDPANPAIRTNLARALWNTGEAERAQDEAKKSLEIDDNQGMGWLILGSIQRSLGLDDDAITSIRRAVQIIPGHMEANFLLARLLYNVEDPDACLKPSEEIYAEHGDGTEAAMCRAELLFQSGKFVEAQLVLENNLDVENDALRLNVLNVLANTRRALGDMEGAIECHKKAMQVSMDYPITRYHYGRTLVQSGDYAKALTRFQEVGQAFFRDQSFIGYLAFTQKMINGDENIKRDIENLLKEVTIAPKEIFETVEDLNRDVLKSLKSEELKPVHPLDRNRRVGDRTWEAVVGRPGQNATLFGDLLRDAMVEYLGGMPRDADEHPFTVRLKFGMGAMETWAETLDGFSDFTFAVDKTGWFKAIYFLEVPEACNDEDKKQGWLRLGVPDFGKPGDYTADAQIKPEAGKLVIFPSYYFAGFNALDAGETFSYVGINGQSRAG